jgi:hypothetical protein
LHLSPVSVNRKLSSLRRYFTWASEQGLIKSDTQVLSDSRLKTAVFIPVSAESIPQTEEQTPETYSGFAPVRVAQKSRRGIGLLADALIIIPLASAFNQISHASWVARGKPVFESSPEAFGFQKTSDYAGNVKNLPKSFYAPTEISIANFPTYRKALHKARYSRPNWYIKYHSYPFTSYLHLGVLMIAVVGLAYVLFINLDKSSRNDVVLGTVTFDSPRLLSYQGRITDQKGNPIDATTNLRMTIYRSENSTGSALLWQEVISATPGPNGVFNVVLGKNTPIRENFFPKTLRSFSELL